MRTLALVLAPLVIALTPWLAGALRQEPWTMYMWIGFGGCFGAFAGAFLNERQKERKSRNQELDLLSEMAP